MNTWQCPNTGSIVSIKVVHAYEANAYILAAYLQTPSSHCVLYTEVQHIHAICHIGVLANVAQIDGLAEDCSNSSALAMELLQSCAKPSIMWSATYTTLTTIRKS